MSRLSWNRCRKLVAHCFDETALVDSFDVHLLVLGPPASELTFDVLIVFRETTESRLVHVDVVQLSERRGEVVADDPSRRFTEFLLGLVAVTQYRALDELHDVERSVVDRLVRAQSEGRGDGYSQRVKC